MSSELPARQRWAPVLPTPAWGGGADPSPELGPGIWAFPGLAPGDTLPTRCVQTGGRGPAASHSLRGLQRPRGVSGILTDPWPGVYQRHSGSQLTEVGCPQGLPTGCLDTGAPGISKRGRHAQHSWSKGTLHQGSLWKQSGQTPHEKSSVRGQPSCPSEGPGEGLTRETQQGPESSPEPGVRTQQGWEALRLPAMSVT